MAVCVTPLTPVSRVCPGRITNLKFWGGSEQITSRTLMLLNDLSVGYSSVRKLVKLDEVQFLLNNHTVSGSGRRWRHHRRAKELGGRYMF